MMMTDETPKMKTMFGGETSGGFFDLPLASVGDIANADIVVL
ncbi:MAG: hypothetical protein ACI87H_003324, partial [Gammaproteobacteria bacterium]